MERRLLTLLCWAMSPAILAQPSFTTLSDPALHEFVYVDEAPRCLNLSQVRHAIEYPLAALKDRIEGRVHCRILIDEEGNYLRHVVLRSAHRLLSHSVEKHISSLRFTPAQRGDSTIRVWVNQYFDFHVNEQSRVRAMRRDNITYLRRRGGADPSEGLRLLETGLDKLAKGAYMQASFDLENAVRLLPRRQRFNRKHHMPLFRAYLHLAQAELALERPQRARRHLTEAIGMYLTRRRPNGGHYWDFSMIQAHLLRAEADLQLGNPIHALDDLNWIRVHPYGGIIPELGVLTSKAYASMGDYEKALNSLQQTFELRPDFVQAHLQKAQLILALGNRDMACEILQEARHLCTDKSDVAAWQVLNMQTCSVLLSTGE